MMCRYWVLSESILLNCRKMTKHCSYINTDQIHSLSLSLSLTETHIYHNYTSKILMYTSYKSYTQHKTIPWRSSCLVRRILKAAIIFVLCASLISEERINFQIYQGVPFCIKSGFDYTSSPSSLLRALSALLCQVE